MSENQVNTHHQKLPFTYASESNLEPFQALALSMVLQQLTERITILESKLSSAIEKATIKPNTVIEYFKVILGGWPALGLIFLVLFYSPLRDALNAIPEKVRSANEIGAFGVSLKSSIEREAAIMGVGNLSETIPTLSQRAIERLLRSRNIEESLISFMPNSNGDTEAVNFPSPEEVTVLAELEEKGLIKITAITPDLGLIKGKEVESVIIDFQKKYPGILSTTRSRERSWELNNPLKDVILPNIKCQLTELGQKGVQIIIKSVAEQLSPKSKG